MPLFIWTRQAGTAIISVDNQPMKVGDACMDFCEMTRQLWRVYLLHRTPGEFEQAFHVIDPECVIIGTGRHEFYTDSTQLAQALAAEQSETEGVQFQIVEESYDQRLINEDTCLVYGNLHVRDADTEKDAIIDMSVRFAVVYARRGQDWKIVYLHQSIPYAEQKDGEYYPKTLTEKVRETRHLAEQMARLAHTDHVTGLYNHRAFFEQCDQHLSEGPAYFMLLDLDDFKQVNDTLGHLAGDEILREVGSVLRSALRRMDVAGRVGGDEFAVLCPGVEDDDVALGIAQRIISEINQEVGQRLGCRIHLSIGVARGDRGEDVRVLFQHADEAMYMVKRGGKNGCALYYPAQ